jgi:hypothetical protein
LTIVNEKGIAPELASSVPTPNKNEHFMDYLPSTNHIEKLKFRNISSEEVERMLAKMLSKKSFLSDLISNKILKFIAGKLAGYSLTP